MLFVRSLLFNIAFYANLIVWLIACIPFFVLPRRWFMKAIKGWALSSLWLLRLVAGIKVEFRGLENIPQGGLLIASKHQSLWETFALFAIFDDVAFILKRELMWIPFFGWYAKKARMISVDRSGGATALRRMADRAREEAARGRQIVIFAEGTRRAPGAAPAYKYGAAYLYQRLGVPCLPVALNSGLFWPRRQFIRRPGTIVVECLEIIPANQDRDAFFQTMQARIEDASTRLFQDGLASLKHRHGASSSGPARPSPDA